MTTMNTKLYATLASLVQARLNCIKSKNAEWLIKHEQSIVQIVKDLLPSGSGIDCGTKIDLDASNGEKLVLTFCYHHMNEHGYYDGWTDHKAVVTPSFAHDFNLVITGRNRNEVKEYLHETYSCDLSQHLDYQRDTGKYVALRETVSN